MNDRYDISGNPEGLFQPGYNDTVLLNKMSIADPEEMEGIEFDLLADLQERLPDELQIDQAITCKDLRDWHKRWLGSIYTWAGDYRSVNMVKNDFVFAASHLIPKLMTDFENEYLSRYTPCESFSDERLIEALAVCHVEFIIIHPFREGNGRLGRLLATVMALQADKPPLNFEYLVGNKSDYVAAIHAGHAGDYGPMKTVFSLILKMTEESYREKGS